MDGIIKGLTMSKLIGVLGLCLVLMPITVSAQEKQSLGLVAVQQRSKAQEREAEDFGYEIRITNNSNSLSKISYTILPSSHRSQAEERNKCLRFSVPKTLLTSRPIDLEEIQNRITTVFIQKGKTESVLALMNTSESCEKFIGFSLDLFRPNFIDAGQTNVRDVSLLFRVQHMFANDRFALVSPIAKIRDPESHRPIEPLERNFFLLGPYLTRYNLQGSEKSGTKGLRLDISTNDQCDFPKRTTGLCIADFQINDEI
jgi:hypothetical protein